ncbi:histone-lysine N-methyltransferase SETMAR-like [Lasioglossum baleicum]|uniref:histone-lysine N-methyltransferase SETMAR-like n=1 Tax=Lasioglossum baleicum TaxID=434251 RepID=UPI003FCCA6CD
MYGQFAVGRTEMGDAPRSGRPPVQLDDNRLLSVVKQSPHLSLKALSQLFAVSTTTISERLRRLNYSKLRTIGYVFTPTDESRDLRVENCVELLLRNQRDSTFLSRIITCDERWLVYEDPRPPAFWSPRNPSNRVNPAPTTPLPQLRQQKRVRSKITKKVRKPKKPLLLQDMAQPHISSIARASYQEGGVKVLPHPPHSPDLSPCDYSLFRGFDNITGSIAFAIPFGLELRSNNGYLAYGVHGLSPREPQEKFVDTFLYYHIVLSPQTFLVPKVHMSFVCTLARTSSKDIYA